MPITIFGSWKDYKGDYKGYTLEHPREEFVEACETIGREMAEAEQQIIVNSDSSDTADYHVVKGVVDRAGSDSTLHPLVHYVRPATGSIFGELSRQYNRLFSSHLGALSREGSRIISVQDADAVLTIGGAAATYRAGLAAIVARKTLVPVASFGGASRALLDTLQQSGRIRNIKEFGPLGNSWGDGVKETALRLSGVTRPPRLLIIHGRGDDRDRLLDWLSDVGGVSRRDLKVMGKELGVGIPLPRKFEELASDVDAAIALATPDDVGRLEAEASEKDKPRARQNVWLEVGWFWGRLGTDKVMILRKGGTEIPSDLQGLEYYSYDRDPNEVGDKIRQFIHAIQRR